MRLCYFVEYKDCAIRDDPCKNDAKCYLATIKCSIKHYVCSCKPGYAGTYCEKSTRCPQGELDHMYHGVHDRRSKN